MFPTKIAGRDEFAASHWLGGEVGNCDFRDKRLDKRFKRLAADLAGSIGDTIPMACQDWANTKAAYRFPSNPKVTEQDILAGHFQSTCERFSATDNAVLVLHDTTEFSYSRNDQQAVGILNHSFVRAKGGKTRRVTTCGISMHSSLVVTTDGLPLGLAAVKFWSRDKFKGTNALKRSINPTRMPIEKKESFRWLENLKAATALLGAPRRCVHIGDRESDIYELFCTAREVGTSFLIRTCVDRLAGDGGHTVSAEMQQLPIKCKHKIEVRDAKGSLSAATLEIKYKHLRVLPPIGKKKQYPELNLTVIHAREHEPPQGRERIDWKLITDLPVRSRKDAVRMLRWYALRWKIEVFHKILKSGCKAEDSRLRTAARLTNLISVFRIISWRIFWMTMINRSTVSAPASLALSELEISVLDRLAPDPFEPAKRKCAKLSLYLTKIARLGGYLARAHDPPPGNTVMWRGLSRLTDILLGFELGSQLVGN